MYPGGQAFAEDLLPSQSVRLRRGDHLRVAQYTDSMRISPTLLSPAALRAVVEEFVTRDGTDYSSIEQRIETVLRQLDSGVVELHFDDKTETCNVLPVEEKSPAADADE